MVIVTGLVGNRYASQRLHSNWGYPSLEGLKVEWYEIQFYTFNAGYNATICTIAILSTLLYTNTIPSQSSPSTSRSIEFPTLINPKHRTGYPRQENQIPTTQPFCLENPLQER